MGGGTRITESVLGFPDVDCVQSGISSGSVSTSAFTSAFTDSFVSSTGLLDAIRCVGEIDSCLPIVLPDNSSTKLRLASFCNATC